MTNSIELNKYKLYIVKIYITCPYLIRSDVSNS